MCYFGDSLQTLCQSKSNKKHGVTINTTLHKKQKNEIGNKNEVQECNCYKCKLSTSRSASSGRCSLKSWVFKSFLKVERDARGTTWKYLKILDCRTCTDGRAKRRSLDEHSIPVQAFYLFYDITVPRRIMTIGLHVKRNC